jgi:hypothetical protein
MVCVCACVHACVCVGGGGDGGFLFCFSLVFSLNDLVGMWVLEVCVEIHTGCHVKCPLCFGLLWPGSYWLPLWGRFCCKWSVYLLFCFLYCRFTCENQRITVQEYFTRIKGVTLQYPHLPCLHVGSLNRENPIYLPPEVRNILFLTDGWSFLHSKSPTQSMWKVKIGYMCFPFCIDWINGAYGSVLFHLLY